MSGNRGRRNQENKHQLTDNENRVLKNAKIYGEAKSEHESLRV